MSRQFIVIRSAQDRSRALSAVTHALDGARVEVKAPKRTLPQNDRMWLLLTEVSRIMWHGQKYTPEEWKDYFMHAYRGEKWMPFEDGGMIPIGRSTSALSKDEHGELMTLIEAFCARKEILLPWDREEAPSGH